MAIITISGKPGSGKSTTGKLLAKKLNYKHYSSGDFMREMAEEQHIDFMDFIKQAEEDPGIDQEIDERQIMLGKQEDDFVIDARLGFHFIPDSVKVFIDADIDKRAERIFNDKIRVEHNATLQKTKENIIKREENEKKRYLAYYNLDPFDKSNYDIIIDTTDISPQQAVEKILSFIDD